MLQPTIHEQAKLGSAAILLPAVSCVCRKPRPTAAGRDRVPFATRSFSPALLRLIIPPRRINQQTMSVRVVARIRPLLDKENDRDIIVRADRAHEGKPLTIVKIPSPKNEAEEFSFAFNGVYDQSTTQEELFTAEG